MQTNILGNIVFLLFIGGLLFLYMLDEVIEAAGGIVRHCMKWDGLRIN